MISPDFILSDWFLIWFALYSLYWQLYGKNRPKASLKNSQFGALKFAFYVGLIADTIMLALIVGYVSWSYSIHLLIIVYLIKVLPLQILWDVPVCWKRDARIFLGLFLVYAFYLYLNKETVYHVYTTLVEGARQEIRGDIFLKLLGELDKWLRKSLCGFPFIR
jgi:hypothetical protein